MTVDLGQEARANLEANHLEAQDQVATASQDPTKVVGQDPKGLQPA